MIIEALSSRIAAEIRRADPEAASTAVLIYALNFIFNFFFAIVLSVAGGLFTGHLGGTMLAFAAFAVLRFCSAGFHLKSMDACTLLSSALFILIPIIASYVSSMGIIIFTSAALIVMLFWAPNVMEESNMPPAAYPYLRIASVTIIIVSFFFLSPVVALAFFAQALLVVPWKEVSNHAKRNRS